MQQDYALELQEMMQEDEGATIRIEELERKLRLAESLAVHIYTRYEDLAQESHEEHSQLDEVRSKMSDVTSEMPECLSLHPRTKPKL